MRLCRSSSESKVSNKSKKAEERANKSRSVHFDGSSSPNHYGKSRAKKCGKKVALKVKNGKWSIF